MNSLLSFIDDYKEEISISSNISIKVKGLSVKDICILSNKHLKTINKLAAKFEKKDIGINRKFFNDLVFICIIDEEVEIKDIESLSLFKLNLILSKIYELTIPDFAFLKSYKIKISSAKSSSNKYNAQSIASEKYAEEAKKNREKAIGFSDSIENLIIMCEYLISRNVLNAYDISLKSLFNKYKIHAHLENKESMRLINVLGSILMLHHGESTELNELINNISEY